MQTRKRLFDMDGTLYPYTPKFMEEIQLSIAMAAIELGAPLTIDEAFALSKKSYYDDQHSALIFERKYGFDHADIIRTSFDLSKETIIPHDQNLTASFQNAALQHKNSQVILTASMDHWADKVVSRLGLVDCFKAVVCLNHCDFKLKHDSVIPYETSCAILNADMKDMDLIEDSKANLEFAKTLGLRTIYVHYGQALDSLPSYIDHQIATPDQAYNIT